MAYKDYERMLTWVAQYANLPTESFALDPVLEVKGSRLRFDYLATPRLCRISLTLPSMPQEDRALFSLMLESNARPGEELLPVLALDPLTKSPLMLLHFPVKQGAEQALAFLFDIGLEILLDDWRALSPAGASAASGVLASRV
jgi:hypothetical protein